MPKKIIKPTTLKAISPNEALEKQFKKKLTQLSLTISKSFSYWAMATYNKHKDKNVSKQLSFTFNELLKQWNKNTKDLAKTEAKKMTKEVTGYVNSNLGKQNEAFKLKTIPKDVRQTMGAIYERNYNLIKTIPQDIMQRYQSAFLNNVSNFDQEAIYKQVETIDGISERRAEIIARDQTQKAISQYHAVREKNLGFEYYVWQTAKDERTSAEHRKLEGRIYRYDEATAVIDQYGNVGHPTDRVNCLASGQGVDLSNRVCRLFRAGASDKFTFVSFENSNIVVTRKHKMLTANGWVTADSLKEGDQVINIGDKTKIIKEVDLYKNKVIISQIFSFIDKSFSSPFSDALGLYRSGVAGDFDADIRLDEHIDIIDINSFLEKGAKVIGFQCFKDFHLSTPRELVTIDTFLSDVLSAECASYLDVLSLFDTLNGFVCFFSNESSIFSSGIFESNEIGFTARANFISQFQKSINNSSPRHVELFTHFKNTIASNVELFKLFYVYMFFTIWRKFGSSKFMLGDMPSDSIVSDVEFLSNILNSCTIKKQVVKSIETKSFTSHIYSLESDLGYYTIDGQINKNCRCRRRAVILQPNQDVKRVSDSAGDYYVIIEKE